MGEVVAHLNHLLEDTLVAPLTCWPPPTSHTHLVPERATMVQGALMVAMMDWILLMRLLRIHTPPCSPLL